MPSSFLKKFGGKQNIGSKGKSRYFTYDRDIVCLPLPSDSCSGNVVRIPRCREVLYEEGLVGRIHLTTDMSEDELFDEIRSVF